MEFKQQRRLRRRKRQLKMNIREMVRTLLQLLLLARIQYSLQSTLYKWTVRRAVEVFMANEMFTVVCSRCP